jgi:glycosyltransferase involved in cell wall biosynthesis
MLTGLPAMHARTVRVLRELHHPGCLNVLCRYGPPGIEDVLALRVARRRGYKTVFYLVEDYDVAGGISSASSHRVQNWLARVGVRLLPKLADALLVINRPLSEKYRRVTRSRLPIHLCPVVVELTACAGEYRGFGQPVRLLYAGSFGVKDGVGVLLDAFGELVHRGYEVRLALSGRGEEGRMRTLHERIGRMSCRAGIENHGFLADEAYQALLQTVDIPCMTRVDTPYAQAGFPFKLAEYLASGRPVIASRMEVLEEYLCDRVSAMLVKPGCAVSLVAAIEWLLAHPAEALAMGRAGRQTAERHFGHVEAGKRLRDFFMKLGTIPGRPGNSSDVCATAL